jgi:hypothetical protein
MPDPSLSHESETGAMIFGKYKGAWGKVKSSCKYPGGGKNERN